MLLVAVITDLVDEIVGGGVPFDLIIAADACQNRHFLLQGEVVLVVRSREALEPLATFRADNDEGVDTSKGPRDCGGDGRGRRSRRASAGTVLNRAESVTGT